MLKNYDPNIHSGVHKVVVTIKQWGHTAQFEYEVHGNCKGMSVLETAVDSFLDMCYDQEDLVLTLISETDGELEYEIAGTSEEDLRSMITAVEIIAHREEIH